MLLESSSDEGKSISFATSVIHSFAGSWNLFIGRPIGGLPGMVGGCPGGEVQLEDVSRLTGLFPGGPVGTLGAPGDDDPSPGMCRGGNISVPP